MTNPTPNGRRAIRELPGGRSIAYYPALARIAGGVTAGVFLAQLFYWHDKGADPAGWIYKTQAEWQDEADLTRWEKETARRMGANKDVETRQTSVWESHNHAETSARTLARTRLRCSFGRGIRQGQWSGASAGWRSLTTSN